MSEVHDVDEGWARVASLEGLTDRPGVRAMRGDVAVLLVRSGERVFAVGNRCTHQGAPLDRGLVRIGGSERTVTCPAHGSVFRLDDGSVARSPATKPIPVYDVRIEADAVWIRPRG